jgi:hypothetical protein
VKVLNSSRNFLGVVWLVGKLRKCESSERLLMNSSLWTRCVGRERRGGEKITEKVSERRIWRKVLKLFFLGKKWEAEMYI